MLQNRSQIAVAVIVTLLYIAAAKHDLIGILLIGMAVVLFIFWLLCRQFDKAHNEAYKMIYGSAVGSVWIVLANSCAGLLAGYVIMLLL